MRTLHARMRANRNRPTYDTLLAPAGRVRRRREERVGVGVRPPPRPDMAVLGLLLASTASNIYYTAACAPNLKSDDDATAPAVLSAEGGGSWSHPGWWAHCGTRSPYCLDKNHCLCLPPLPKRMQSYQMNLSTVTYFIGNASGMDSPAELEAEARFGNVGVGWQIDGIPKQWAQGLEVVELAEAKRLKAIRPDVRVLVSRQSEVGTKMWNTVAALIASDPTNSKQYFTSCRGRPCKVKWETDDSFFFNWANPALRDWWVYTYVGGALNESAIDGVYLGASPLYF